MAGGASKWNVTAMSDNGATASSNGSEMNSAPGGTVTSALPANRSGRSLAGSIAGDEDASGRAM